MGIIPFSSCFFFAPGESSSEQRLEKPEKFADFINGSLYNGRQILHPKQVAERQTVYTREDKLNPVTTIVFYHGADIYDGCTNLHDMLNWEKENGNFKQYVPNYHINLVTLASLDERNFQTGVRELIGFLKHSTSKTELKRYCMENEQRIQQMDDDTFNTVNEEGFSDTRIIEKLQKRFNLDPSSARNYFLKYSSNRENP